MVRSDRAKTLDEVLALHPALAGRSRNWQPVTQPSLNGTAHLPRARTCARQLGFRGRRCSLH